uniref:BTB domain-containing protein n=1 Tax=Leersia perrieri TaxID=77586 RepID=A0A0D9XJW2_9ORYZ
MEKKELESSEYLKDDSFTIRCDVIVDIQNAAALAAFVVVSPSDMHRHFTDLLVSGQGADVMFDVGGKMFAAHRCVLAARSTVFKAELFGPMKEGTATSIIQISDMEPGTFDAMLRFIYSDSPPEMEGDEDVNVMWQSLLVAANRYDLQRLVMICEKAVWLHHRSHGDDYPCSC